MTAYALYAVIGFVIILIASAIRILREYERGVIFLLGRFWKVKGPGFIIVIPFIQQMVRVDLRTIVMDVPSQDVISRDNVSVHVNAVVYFRVMNPRKAIVEVENFHYATSQLSQTTLRSVLGQHELDDMLAERDKLNTDIQEILDRATDAWGIKVANVEKMMPASFISKDGFGITQRCRNYLEPLIRGEDYPPYSRGLPRTARLKGAAVKPRLGTKFVI